MNTSRPRSMVHLVAIATIGAVVLGACTTAGASSPSPVATATPAATATPSSNPAPATAQPTATPSSSASTGQTDTGWGRIWDQLPPSFPSIQGAEPTQTGAGPASAVLDVPGTASNVADAIRTSLEADGFATAAMNSQENGSVVIDSTGSGDCRIQTTVAPMGGNTTVTIYYGAGCPFS